MMIICVLTTIIMAAINIPKHIHHHHHHHQHTWSYHGTFYFTSKTYNSEITSSYISPLKTRLKFLISSLNKKLIQYPSHRPTWVGFGLDLFRVLIFQFWGFFFGEVEFECVDDVAVGGGC
ncbi:hypothetical protein RND81_05G171600 [Saponaria officinalis]|uniref:Transmembrane protein n=1 Tax=Saponaria officinalis TaxID=3572 RepID=A0AAW1KZB8_SAPOF